MGNTASNEQPGRQAGQTGGVRPVAQPLGAYAPTPFYPTGLYQQRPGGAFPQPPPSNGQFYGSYPAAPPNAYPPYPQAQPPPRAPEQTQRTNTIRNNVNLKKPTLKVVPVPEEPGKFTVQFTFDAATPCWVSVFVLAREEPAAACRLTPLRDEAPARVARPAGLAQTFTWEELFDPSRYNVDDLVQAEGEQYPLCVRLETIPVAPADAAAAAAAGGAAAAPARVLPEPAGCALPQWVQSQTTYASLAPGEGGSWNVRVIKQRIWVDGVSYELQEIYGIENCATGNAEEDATAGKECVVCLSEPRDTTVLPCRHMCMCSGCARMLRHQTNRCPICRTPVESLLEIKVERKPAPAPRPAAA